jgi:hypothetical protein
MKTFLACATVACFALAGCGDYRDSMMTTPDRHGHADSDPSNPAQPGLMQNRPQAVPGKEMYITLGAQDSLSSVAKAYNVTLEWLIKRNRLTASPKAGDNIIVPNK